MGGFGHGLAWQRGFPFAAAASHLSCYGRELRSQASPTFTASQSSLRGWDPLTLPPGPRERWVPARMLLLTGLRASISPLSAKHAVGCSRPTLLPLGWTARPLIPQLGWDNTSQSPGCPGLWWARGHLARPGISASSGPHAPRWLRLAEEGRAKGSPPHGHPVTGCWLRRSRPAASGSSLIQESLLGSDPEGTRRSGSSTGPTQQQSGTEQTFCA